MTSSAVIYVDKRITRKGNFSSYIEKKMHIKLILFTVKVIEKLYISNVHPLKISNNSYKSFLMK